MRYRICGAGIAVCMLTAGCAGRLTVYDAQKAEVPGMPFRTAEIYVKQGTHNKATQGGACAPTRFQETVALATGPLFYAKATTAQLAKTAFHIKYNDVGGVSEVGLDSEPAGAENIKATTDLIKSIGPLVGLAVAVAAEPASPKACDAGEDSVTYETLDAYLKKHPSP